MKGNCAEVGVFRGENASKINEAFKKRLLYLFDTFAGFSSLDTEIESQYKFSDAKQGQYADTSVELVMSKMKYPQNIVIKKGYFPESAKMLRTSSVL